LTVDGIVEKDKTNHKQKYGWLGSNF